MIQLARLWERDGGKCHLCGKNVPMRTRRQDNPLAPSRDHITPQKHGGKDSPDNLRLAHAYCNSRRGDLPVDEFKAIAEQARLSAEKAIPRWQVEMRLEAQKRRERRQQIFEQIRG